MAAKRKVIITCAVTGAIHTPTMSPHLPITPDEITREALAAAEAGASILHLHARNPETGQPDQTPAAFGRFLPRIKQGTNAVINITTGGSPYMKVEERVLPAALFCKAVALAAREVAALNGFWQNDTFTPGDGVHLGIAIALRGGGLVAPAIRNADQLALPEVMTRLRDLTARARGGRLRGSEMTDATITVTNLGDQGVRTVFGVIYPPQVALVGFGRVADRVWADDGSMAVRPVVSATLSADHRATDGRIGARFLALVERVLHRPEEL
jgi:hypothetical protein